MKDIAGLVAVVTGAAQGNGRAISLGLAQYGAKVICCDIQGDEVQATAADIRREGLAAHAVRLDISEHLDCHAAASEAERQFGPVSILVNNAGILLRTPPDSPTYLADWDKTLAVNVGGTIRMVHAFLPQLRRTHGRIVNIASIMSISAAPTMAAYAASKGAILQMTKSLAHDLANDGIRVNAIAPGVIETAMTAATRANPDAIRKFMAHTPLARAGKPEELVGPVAFLASSASSYVTGAMLAVDGGYLAA